MSNNGKHLRLVIDGRSFIRKEPGVKVKVRWSRRWKHTAVDSRVFHLFLTDDELHLLLMLDVVMVVACRTESPIAER